MSPEEDTAADGEGGNQWCSVTTSTQCLHVRTAKLWKEANASTTLTLYWLLSKPNRPWEWLSESPMLLFHPRMMLGNLYFSTEWLSLPLAFWRGAMVESHGKFGRTRPIPLQCVCSEDFELGDFMVILLSHCSCRRASLRDVPERIFTTWVKKSSVLGGPRAPASNLLAADYHQTHNVLHLPFLCADTCFSLFSSLCCCFLFYILIKLLSFYSKSGIDF